jgi:serine protease
MEATSAIAKTRRHLSSARPGALESADLPDQAELAQRVEKFLAGSDLKQPALARSLRDQVEWALRALYEGAPIPDSANGAAGLEAVIIADGARPVFFVSDDRLVLAGAGEGPFVNVVRDNVAGIEAAALSVGRVETDDKLPPAGMDKWYEGTAFLVADILAMTNRHVIERMVNEPSSGGGPFTLKARYWLNFGAQSGGQTPRRFSIDRVVFAGPQVIGAGGDVTRLDLALLQIGAAEIAGTPRPAPLPLSLDEVRTFQPLAVVGYPAAPRVFTGVGAPPVDHELEDVLRRLFDNRFGFKRCASGEIDSAVGFPADTRGWTIQHDASTLSGNSGSPVLLLANGPLRVSALHFSGRPREENFAHVFPRVAAELRDAGVTLP